MRIVNLSGLIGKEIRTTDCKGNVSASVYMCIGYGTDPDTERPTVFLLNGSSGSVIERDIARITVKSKENAND